MKKLFETPDAEVILLSAQDVIRTSVPEVSEDDPNGGWGGIL